MKLNRKKPEEMWLVAGGIVVLVLAFAVGYKYAGQPKETDKPATTRVVISPTPTSQAPDLANYIEKDTFFNLQAQWLFVSSKKLGISFNYPLPAGEVNLWYGDYGKRDTDPSGQFYSWEISLSSGSDKGYTYSFAGGVSKDFTVGRSGWFTDFYEVQPSDYTGAKNVFKTKYGTDAIWKASPLVGMGESEASPTDFGSVILANLPIKADGRFKGIAIYFRDPITVGDAQKVVDSLKVE